MPAFEITAPNGKKYRVDTPEGTSQDQALQYFYNEYSGKTGIFAIPETAGFLEGLKGGAKRLISSGRTAVEAPFISGEQAAEKGIERSKNITERPATSLEAVKKVYDDEGLLSAAGEALSQIPGAFGEQTPFLASIIAGAKAGARFGPWGALAGSLLVPFLQASGSAMERKAEEQVRKGEEVDINELGAYGVGLGSAALERAALGFSGLSKLFGIDLSKKVASEQAEKIARQSIEAALVKGGGKLIIGEGATEMGQAALERYYADLPLLDDDAKKEYAESAFGAALLFPLGMYSGYSARRDARKLTESEDDLLGVEPESKGPEPSTTDAKPVDKKGWEKVKKEKERQEKIKETEETVNVNEEDIDVDLNDADIIVEQEQFTLPPLQDVEESIKEKADVTRFGQIDSDPDRRSVQLPESKSTKSRKQLSAPQEPETIVRSTVDSNTSDASPADGREGKPLAQLSRIPEEGFERIQVGTQDIITGYNEDGNPVIQQEGLFVDRPKKDFVQETKQLELPLVRDLKEEYPKQSPSSAEELDLYRNSLKSYLNKRQFRNQLGEIISEYDNVGMPYAVTQEGLAEAESMYTSILNSEGKAAADRYIQNKRETDPLFNQTKIETESATTEQENTRPIYATNSLTTARAYLVDNNLNEYYINPEEEYDGRTLAYSIRPKTVLPNTRPITVADFLIRDKGRNLNVVSNPLQFSSTPDTAVVQRILRQKLDTAQFNQLNANPKVFKTIANEFAQRSSDQDAGSTPSQEINTRKARELEFDVRSETLPGFKEFVSRTRALGVKTLPSFLKAGAVFGSAKAPIQGAFSVDEVIENALGDYIFEEAADSQSKVKDFGSGQNVGPADKARRKALRDEFINSPIMQDYFSRNEKAVQAKDATAYGKFNSIEQVNKAIKEYAGFFIKGEKYNSGRDVLGAIQDADIKALKQTVKDNQDKAAVKRAKDKLTEEIKKAAKKYNVKQQELDLSDMEIDEDAEIAIDKILDLPIEVNPFDAMAKNGDDLKGGTIDMFDDRSAITRTIAKFKNNTVALLEDLGERLVRRAELYFNNGDDILGARVSQQAEIVKQYLNIPGIDKISFVLADPKTIKQYQKDIAEATGKPTEFDVNGFYMNWQGIRPQKSGFKKVVNIKGAEYKDTIVVDDSISSTETLHTILHELGHAGTVNGLPNFTDLERRQLLQLFQKARAYARAEGRYKVKDNEYDYNDYGLTNVQEFIAEAFSNQKFQKFLASIPSDMEQLPETGKFKSMFDDFIEWVARALGLENIDNTVLKDVIQVSARAFNMGTKPLKTDVERAKKWKRQQNYKERVDELRLADLEEEQGLISKARAGYRRMATKIMYPEYSVEPMAKAGQSDTNKPSKSDRTFEEQVQDDAKLYEKEAQTFGKRIKNQFKKFLENGDEFLTSAIRNFANRAIDIKKVQDNLERSGLLLRGVDGFNNVFDQLTRAFGLADNYMKSMQPALNEYSEALGEYLDLQKSLGIDEEYAKGFLKRVLTHLHESERREIKYLLSVKLSTEKTIRLKNGKLTSPADLRKQIMNRITNKVWDQSTEAAKQKRLSDLKSYKNQLRVLANPNTKISGKNTVDPVGDSYRKGSAGSVADISHPSYNVVDEVTFAQAAEGQAVYRALQNTNPKLYSTIDRLIKAKDAITQRTKELNAEANYASPQALNIIDFYGWQYYVPFKKQKYSTDSDESFYNPTGGRLSRELKRLESTFEGMQGESEDPLTQTLVDASRAAARAGRISYTQAIYNAVSQTIEYTDPKTGKKEKATAIKGKIKQIYPYEDRYEGNPDLTQDLAGKNTVAHFLDDGSIAIIEIDDEKLVRAIRGVYQDNPYIVTFLNQITGFIGQTHTRFNPPFATLNFVRDAITNIFYVSADLGLKDTGGYIQAVASQITNGGMIETAKAMNMYIKGDLVGLRKYVAQKTKDGKTIPKDLLEYLDNGGMISYSQALSIETAYERLQENIERSKKGVAKTKRSVKDFFDIWMATFELTTRTAAYRVAKQNYLTLNAPGIPESQVSPEIKKAAIERAVVYAKRLSNFEERGIHGDMMGAMYMFFRPSAVGIVRAFESMSALTRKSVNQQNLPDYIKGNPEALEQWSKDFDRRRNAAMGMIASGVGAGYALWHMSALLAGDDEDNPTRDDDPARWTRYARFDISGLPGFGKDAVLQIPWGFGPGGFAAIGAQLAAYGGATKVKPTEILGNIYNIALDSFMPLPFSRMPAFESPNMGAMWILDTAMPTIGRPILEYSMNTNAFGQNIYNPLQSRKYGDAYSGSDNIPELYKDIAIAFAEMSNGKFDPSPNTIAFFANNYADAYSRIAHDFYGISLTARGKKSFDPKRDTIFFDSFISKYSKLDQRQYSEAVEKITDVERRLNLFKDTNIHKYQQVRSEFPAAEGVIERFNQMKAELDKLNSQAKSIRMNTNYSSKEKESLLEIIKEQQLMYKRHITAFIEVGLEVDD